MKTFIVFVGTLLIWGTGFADPEPPIIRGFVKIELLDGSIVQGAIQIGYPSKNYYDYIKNGIYYKIDEYEGIMYFNIDLVYIKYDYKRKSLNAFYEKQRPIGTPNIGVPQTNYVHSYYIDDQLKESYEIEQDTLTYLQEKSQNYKLLDYIPLEIKIGYTYPVDTTSIKKIPLDKIRKISMLKNPPEFLLNQLKSHKEQIKLDVAKSECVGKYPPLWYHELLKDPKLFQEYLLRMKN